MLNYDLDCKPKDAAGAILIRYGSAGEQALLIPRKRAVQQLIAMDAVPGASNNSKDEDAR